MIIRLAQKNEAEQIAEIHKAEIKKGFLSSLKLSFLIKLYRAIIDSKFSFCLAAEENNKVKGFVAGTANIDQLYFYFLRRYFFYSAIMLFPKAFRFENFKKILESLFYPFRRRRISRQNEKPLPKAELLTIALEKEFQGKGIGAKILEKFIEEMKKRKVESFKVIVGEELLPAIKFYEKNGFEWVKNITIHEKQPSRVYIYKL